MSREHTIVRVDKRLHVKNVLSALGVRPVHLVAKASVSGMVLVGGHATTCVYAYPVDALTHERR